MTLGDVLLQAAQKDLAGVMKGKITYSEFVKDGKFEIRLANLSDKEAYIECSVPDKGTEEEKNYLRLYFLSMVFNAAIHSTKRNKNKR